MGGAGWIGGSALGGSVRGRIGMGRPAPPGSLEGG